MSVAPDAEDRRTQIVRGATAVLARQGYEATSMKEIADEIGVSSGLLHYYFGTKEDLLAAVVGAMHHQLLEEWQAAMRPVEGPLNRVAAGMRQASEKFETRPDFWHLLFDLYALGLRNPRLRERVRAMATELVAEIAAEVERVSAEVPSPAPVPPEAMALAIAGAIDGIALLAILTGDDGRDAFRALMAMVMSVVALGMIAGGREVPADLFSSLLSGSPPPPTAGG